MRFLLVLLSAFLVAAPAGAQTPAPELTVRVEECALGGAVLIHWTITNPTDTEYTVVSSSRDVIAGIVPAGSETDFPEESPDASGTLAMDVVLDPALELSAEVTWECALPPTTRGTVPPTEPTTTSSQPVGAGDPPPAPVVPVLPAFTG
jgi:hypothetical protein